MPRNIDADVAEIADLLLVERMVGLVGAGEVAHHQRDAVVRHRRHPGRKAGRLFRPEAEPIHASVEMQRRAAGPALHGAERVPFGELAEVPDHRTRIDLGEQMRRPRHDAVEDVDDGVGEGGAQPPGFGDMRHKECLAAGRGKRRCHRLEPAAIGVGFDHRGAVGRRGAASERAPVRDDGAAVDSQRGARFFNRRCWSGPDLWRDRQRLGGTGLLRRLHLRDRTRRRFHGDDHVGRGRRIRTLRLDLALGEQH